MENPNAPLLDPALTVTRYVRTKEQDHLVGIYEEELKEIAEEDEAESKEELFLSFFLLNGSLHFLSALCRR